MSRNLCKFETLAHGVALPGLGDKPTDTPPPSTSQPLFYLIPRRAYLRAQRPVPRSPPKTAAERGRAGVSTGSDHLLPPRAPRESPSSPELTCVRSARSRGAHPKTAAERGRAGARTGSDHLLPPRAQRESPPSPELTCVRSAGSRGAPQKPQRSGVGPEHALEAITFFPLAHRAKALLPPSLPACAAPDPAEPPKNRSGAGSGRSTHWKRSPPSPSRTARKPFLPRAYLCAQRLIPRSHPKTAAERGRAGVRTGSDHLLPPRAPRESPSSPELTCVRSAGSRGASLKDSTDTLRRLGNG
jgi:hypothetical protein